MESDKLQIQELTYPYKTMALGNIHQYAIVNIEVWLSEQVSFFNEYDEVSYLKINNSKNRLKFQNEFGYIYKFKKINKDKFKHILNISNLKSVN